MNVLLGGDFCPINRAEKLLVEGHSVFGRNLQEQINATDYFIANLECPVTKVNKKIIKAGPHFKSSPKIVKGLSKLGFNALCVANNHFLDYDVEGADETISSIKDAGINVFGYRDRKEEVSSYKIDNCGSPVYILGFSNKEASVNDKFPVGALGINIIDISRKIKGIKKESPTSLVIIFLHTGFFNFQYPSPAIRKMCHYFIEVGADLITCQHSHTIGACEYYEGKMILYGQGSLVFDKYKNDSFWNHALLMNIQINDNNNIESIEKIFIEQFNKTENAEIINDKCLVESHEKMSKVLANEELYHKKWEELVKTKSYEYLLGLSSLPLNKWTKRVNKYVLKNRLLSSNKKVLLRNYFHNDEHREIIENLLLNNGD